VSMVKRHKANHTHELGDVMGLVTTKRGCVRVLLAGLAAGVLLVTAGCGGSRSANNATISSKGLPDTIHLVSINPVTGPIAFVGASANKGYELAIKEINEQKFLGNAKLELTKADTKSASATAAQDLTKAIADKNVSAVFGSVSSAEAVAMSPLAQKAKMPVMYTQAGSDGVIVGDYTYRATPLMKEYYPNLKKYLTKSGWKSIGIIYGESFPSVQQVGSETLPEICKELGIDVVASVGTHASTQDFSAPVAQVLKAKPDGVAVLQSGVPNVTAMNQLRQAGYTGAVIGNPGAGGGTLTPAGADGAGMVWPTDFHPGESAASTQKFVKAYEAEYKEKPLNYAAEAYDAAWFMARAIKDAGSGYRKAIKDGMAQAAKDTVNGALGEGLTWKDQEIQIPGVVVRWNGKSEDLLYEGDGGA
jgi:branched-chain amino acid transport system substrate-binding protein